MSLGSYLDLIDDNEQVDELYVKYAKEYRDKFGCPIPREMIPSSISEESIIEAVKKCINSGDDNLLKQLGITTNDVFLY